jgi:hypothetical protein
MGFLTDWLTDWLKELLIEGIMGNLTGLFDTVNSRVGEIAVQVGTTPAAWNAGVFSLIRQLSETVILPIAGLILTFVATEALELMQAKNHDYDEAWRSMRVTSYTDLILMKIHRTKQIESLSGQTLVSEGIDANYMDMINYSVFGLIKLEFEK